VKSVRKTDRISVLIADANLMACRLLASLLNRHARFEVVAHAINQGSLLRSAQQVKSDVALIGMDLDDGPLSGLAMVQQVREVNPRLRVVLLLDRPDPQVVVDAMRAGSRGVFSRADFESGALCKCVRRVYEGQIWINSMEMEYVFGALAQTRRLQVVDSQGANLLSNREDRVMRLVAEGLCNREIARELNLSEHTVKNYLFHIFDKLGISNRVELVLYAMTNSKKVRPTSEGHQGIEKGRLKLEGVNGAGTARGEENWRPMAIDKK
jgi:DNA-binding NarL/FixJ family response regulator